MIKGVSVTAITHRRCRHLPNVALSEFCKYRLRPLLLVWQLQRVKQSLSYKHTHNLATAHAYLTPLMCVCVGVGSLTQGRWRPADRSGTACSVMTACLFDHRQPKCKQSPLNAKNRGKKKEKKGSAG